MEWAERILKELGTEKDMKLSRQEILTTCPCELKQKEISELFAKMDETEDGLMDITELTNCIKTQTPVM